MFDKSQKEFKISFGPDERIEVVDGEFKSSTGYVSKIIIDRNGIWYEVILIKIVNRSKNTMHPEAIKCLEYMLQTLEV